METGDIHEQVVRQQIGNLLGVYDGLYEFYRLARWRATR